MKCLVSFFSTKGPVDGICALSQLHCANARIRKAKATNRREENDETLFSSIPWRYQLLYFCPFSLPHPYYFPPFCLSKGASSFPSSSLLLSSRLLLEAFVHFLVDLLFFSSPLHILFLTLCYRNFLLTHSVFCCTLFSTSITPLFHRFDVFRTLTKNTFSFFCDSLVLVIFPTFSPFFFPVLPSPVSPNQTSFRARAPVFIPLSLSSYRHLSRLSLLATCKKGSAKSCHFDDFYVCKSKII